MPEFEPGKVWSGNGADFDDLYAWAGAQRHNLRESYSRAGRHALEVHNERTGWVGVQAGQTIMKGDGGLIVVATKAVEPATSPEPPTPDDPEKDKETKAAPGTEPIETKPALMAPVVKAPLQPAKVALPKPAPTA